MKALLLTIPLLLLSTLNAKNVILDTTTSLIWQDAPINEDALVTYKEAKNYCKFLKIDKYEDFRLPTLHELQTLVDYNNYKPAIINGFKYVENTTYWTSTHFADDENEFWTVDFEKGSRSVKAKYYDRHFRCVQKLK
ncbi:MAG: DUF1566 domain-containing protein [Campylobacterota bacterium]|nr:DUF1566 domain-containing protein [Campylobacterota bacterium]